MTKEREWVNSIFRILPNKYLSSEVEVKGTFPFFWHHQEGTGLNRHTSNTLKFDS